MHSWVKYIVLIVAMPFLASGQEHFDKQGHRGGRGLMPENTIAAMKNAIDLGVTLEMDISFTREKLPVVSHDQYISSKFALKPGGDTLTKAEEQKLIIYQLSYKQVKSYDVGRKFYAAFPNQKKVEAHIPLLSALIDSAEAYARQKGAAPPHYNIETKTAPIGDNILHPAPAEFVKLLMQVLDDKKILGRVIIQSFDPRTLEIMHRDYPLVPLAWLVSNKATLKQNLSALTFKPTIYSPEYRMVDKQLVDDCHAAGIKILPWTVNIPDKIKLLKDLGVDGIISDYPNLL
jgi:glycerophosphoryl diester phosphodiesterase